MIFYVSITLNYYVSFFPLLSLETIADFYTKEIERGVPPENVYPFTPMLLLMWIVYNMNKKDTAWMGLGKKVWAVLMSTTKMKREVSAAHAQLKARNIKTPKLEKIDQLLDTFWP